MKATLSILAAVLLVSVIAVLLSGPSSTTQPTQQPSNERFATAAIANAGHPCGTVVHAVELSPTDTRATCSNGEVYRIMWADGKFITMRCSVARTIGVSGC